MGGVKTIDMRVHGNKTKVLTQNKNKQMVSKTNHGPCAKQDEHADEHLQS